MVRRQSQGQQFTRARVSRQVGQCVPLAGCVRYHRRPLTGRHVPDDLPGQQRRIARFFRHDPMQASVIERKNRPFDTVQSERGRKLLVLAEEKQEVTCGGFGRDL